MGSQIYDELAKSLILVVVDDERLDAALKAIRDAAFVGYPGDGKIFVSSLENAYTIRTGKPEL